MSMRATPSGDPAARARSISAARCADQRAVIERVGQRIAARRPRRAPRSGGSAGPAPTRKIRNSSDRRDDRGGQRDRDDVPADPVEPLEDRHGVAPDPDDCADLAVGLDRQELAEERRRSERHPAPRRPRPTARSRRWAARCGARCGGRVHGDSRQPGALAATIVPSRRRSSTRRISPGRVSAASCASSAARSRSVGPVAGSR